jgi:transcriptional regulator with GAF, ATPase, and Fis domain
MLARTNVVTKGSADVAPWDPALANDRSERGRLLRIPVEHVGGAPSLGRAREALDVQGIRCLLDEVFAQLATTEPDCVEDGAVNGLREVAEALQGALEELQQLREGAEQGCPNVRLFGTSRLIVSESEAVRKALAQVEQVAPTPATVLLIGETGVGKEVFAQAIHELSQRHQRPMIRVSCAAIPSALIESELFGRERGAYTGAITRQIGRFEAANQSTLFLDEIGELSAEVQVKLLRVLQERVIERLGSTQSIKVDVRIIAATNRNLDRAVEDKSFREDLFYRLNVFPIVVPPLRERLDDIPGLVWEFINEFSKSLGKSISSISQESMRQLQRYPWPGNIRELRNVIERAVIMATGPRLTVPMPQAGVARATPTPTALTLKELEIEHIRTALKTTNWRVRGRGGAAERLGLKPTTLESRMVKLGVTRPRELA